MYNQAIYSFLCPNLHNVLFSFTETCPLTVPPPPLAAPILLVY